MKTLSISTLLVFSLAGCIAHPGGPSSAEQGKARAMLLDGRGGSRGEARLLERSDGLAVTVKVSGLTPGAHGIHLHTIGRCDPPNFSSAGGHWNPSAHQHGRGNPQGAHDGDLPNIAIARSGRGKLTFTVPHARLDALLDADGAALVIHEKPDDYRTDPSGASGARLVCGIITRS